MKYSARNYGKALVEALAAPKADDKVTAKNFMALVRKNGDEAKLKKILDEAARLARGKYGLREVLVESARPLSKSQEKVLEAFIKPGDVVKRSIDPSLVAGVKLLLNEERQLDGSLRSKLDKIFGA